MDMLMHLDRKSLCFSNGPQMKLPYQISILEFLEQSVNLPQLFLIHVLLLGYLAVTLAQFIRTQAYNHLLPSSHTEVLPLIAETSLFG